MKKDMRYYADIWDLAQNEVDGQVWPLRTYYVEHCYSKILHFISKRSIYIWSHTDMEKGYRIAENPADGGRFE